MLAVWLGLATKTIWLGMGKDRKKSGVWPPLYPDLHPSQEFGALSTVSGGAVAVVDGFALELAESPVQTLKGTFGPVGKTLQLCVIETCCLL